MAPAFLSRSFVCDSRLHSRPCTVHVCFDRRMARSGNVSMDRNLLDYREPTSWDDVMFEQSSRRPWKKVALALFLCLAGTGMLTGGICSWHAGSPGDGTATALLVLGSLCFLPGAFYTRIAYLAWKGVSGYSMDLIPDF